MPTLKDLTGMRFGRLIVVNRIEDHVSSGGVKSVQWLCKCDCGNYTTALSRKLMLGRKTSCGCRMQSDTGKKFVGKKFDMLTVLSKTEKRNPSGFILYECLCDCGNICYRPTHSLTNKKFHSCGCQTMKYKNSKEYHRMTNTRIYHIYYGMKTRCYNPQDKNDRKYYAEKGIKVCQEWLDSFLVFYEWSMKNGYNDNMTIDRIDSSKDYCSENCRWITMRENLQNKSVVPKYHVDGLELTLSELADHYDILYNTLRNKQRANWSESQIIDYCKSHIGFRKE